MKISHLFASMAILVCTTAAWFLLGTALDDRTDDSSRKIRAEVAGLWGPPIIQLHPQAWYETPNAPGGKAVILPSSSKVAVGLAYAAMQRGLLWNRTYDASLTGAYVFTNPTRIAQTFYISFPLPTDTAGLKGFAFRLGEDADQPAAIPGSSGAVTRAVVVPALGSVSLNVAYQTRGTNTWSYQFQDNRRISGFRLDMLTDFPQIDFPIGTASADENRTPVGKGLKLFWDYPDVLAAKSIGMEMPKKLNAGPIAARIVFFAPVSLLFFVTIIILIGSLRGVALHPMHIFFVAAGFFAFHLLFAYLVDLLSLPVSFGIATLISLALVCTYLRAVGGKTLLLIALPAQLIYLILFSASFFIDGLTGITLTLLGIITLAILMTLTAKVDWRAILTQQAKPSAPNRIPPPIGGPAQPSLANEE